MANEEFQALNDDELDQVVGGRKHGKKKRNGTPHIDENRCIHCGVCADMCRQDAIIDCGSCYRVDASRCNGCGSCVDNCPVVAAEW